MINSSTIILCRRFKPAITVSPLTGLNVANVDFSAYSGRLLPRKAPHKHQ